MSSVPANPSAGTKPGLPRHLNAVPARGRLDRPAGERAAVEHLGTKRSPKAKVVLFAARVPLPGRPVPEALHPGAFRERAYQPLSELGAGEAKVLQIDGDKAAVYRDDDGSIHAVSAVCTHMGCLGPRAGGAVAMVRDGIEGTA